MNDIDKYSSPRWSSTTKLIAGLTFVAVLAFLVVRFQNFLGPLLLTFIVAYLFYPAAIALLRWLKLPWRLAVTLIYLVVVLVLIGLLTVGGFALVGQVQSLIAFVQQALVSLPEFLQNLSHQHFALGPFQFDLSTLDLSTLSQDVLGVVQPMLGQVSGLVGRLASSTASLFGWIAFILLVSYFILSETGGMPGRLLRVEVPGYDADLHRMGTELSHIWNAFLRGQLIIFGIYIVVYTVLLTIFGVRYAIWLALLAGLAKFVPYVGPAIVWVTYGLVAGFQGTTIFGLAPWSYVIMVVATSMVIDTLMDNLLTTRVMASALKLHPAAVLIAALAGASFLGLIGVVLAAPVLATLKLFVDYVFSKMFDRDPWVRIESEHTRPIPPVTTSLHQYWDKFVSRLRRRTPKMDEPPKMEGK